MDITANTKLVGIIGHPVSHSLSPLMHNAAYRAMGLDFCYVPLPVNPDELGAAVDGLRALQFRGVNVTIPHKVEAVRHMDELADSAARTGALNTIVNEQGWLTGHNTDGYGFIRSLEAEVELDYEAAPVLIIGAGGAARSVGVALAERGVPHIGIVNRTIERAGEFRELLTRSFPSLQVEIRSLDEDYDDLITGSRILVNTTSVGMEGNLKGVLIGVDKISKEHVVCDVVYTNEKETPFMRAGRERGATTLGGLGMLLHQGAEAILLWAGLEPPLDIMREAIGA